MMKLTNNKKKVSVTVGAPAPSPATSVAAQPAAPVKPVVTAQPAAAAKPSAPSIPKATVSTAAQPASTKAESPHAARIALQLVEPAAKHVYVAGSFNGWKPDSTPLAPLGNGRWKGDLNLGPGRHEYLFVVDGRWLPDPNAQESVQNPFGGRNSVLTVSE